MLILEYNFYVPYNTASTKKIAKKSAPNSDNILMNLLNLLIFLSLIWFSFAFSSSVAILYEKIVHFSPPPFYFITLTIFLSLLIYNMVCAFEQNIGSTFRNVGTESD